MSLFEDAGGETAIRQVLTTFYNAVFSDVMIGFHFMNADKERLIKMETQLTCIALGAKDMKYEGKPIKEAHAPHPILGGQFERRLQLLKEAMKVHSLPQAVQEEWIAHSHKLRPLVTADHGSECDHDLSNQGLKIPGDSE